jgi:D-glycero-D-manno-heptose 1,7-bisphosphate phosphatase
LFLDRDGVILESVPYLHRAQETALIPGAAETIVRANRLSVPVVIVTNQAGIGRGYYGWDEFRDVQSTLLVLLQDLGARIDGVFACPHHERGLGVYLHSAHPARKPRPGMLLRAAERMNLDLRNSWMAGDTSGDVAAGRAAGLRGGILVTAGLGSTQQEAALALRSPEFEVMVSRSLQDASGSIPLLATS